MKHTLYRLSQGLSYFCSNKGQNIFKHALFTKNPYTVSFGNALGATVLKIQMGELFCNFTGSSVLASFNVKVIGVYCPNYILLYTVILCNAHMVTTELRILM